MNRPLLLSLLFATPLCAQTPIAFCADTDQDLLYSMDLTTGAVTVIGSTLTSGLATAADLCWRDDTNEIWTIDLAGGEAGTINPLTGAFTTVWNTGTNGWQAMAWDHTTNQFYVHNQNDQLSRLDPATGVLTLVGTLSPTTPLVTALEVDATGRLWAINFTGGAIFELSKTTGLQIGPTIPTLASIQGFSIDAEGVWYGISTTTDSLYRIDPATGATTLIGPNTGTTFVKGMVITSSAVQRAGSPCPDGLGTVRRMTWSGGSNLGNTLFLGCDAGALPSVNLIIYGLTPVVPALDLGFIGAPGCLLYESPDLIAGGTPTGVQLPFLIPASPVYVGVTVFAQSLIIDATPTPNPLGFVLSDVAKFTVTL